MRGELMPLVTGPAADPDWVDRPVWTAEKLAEAKRKQQERAEREALQREPAYGGFADWMKNYEGVD